MPCEATLSLNASKSAVFVTGPTSGYLDRRSVTGHRCSLLVRVPAPLTINMTLHSLVGAGVSSDRVHSRSSRCPLELVIEDGSRRHSGPLCPLRQHRQRNVYQSHDSQIRVYFTHSEPSRHHHNILQHTTAPHRRHRPAFIVKIEGTYARSNYKQGCICRGQRFKPLWKVAVTLCEIQKVLYVHYNLICRYKDRFTYMYGPNCEQSLKFDNYSPNCAKVIRNNLGK